MERKTTIVLVINDLEGRGATTVVGSLARGILKYTDAECHVVCLKDLVEYEMPAGISVHTPVLPKKNFFNALFYRKHVAEAVDRYILANIGKPDLVLSNLTHTDRVMMHSRLPVVHVIHNTYPRADFGGVHDEAKKKKLVESTYVNHPITCVSKGALDGILSFCKIRQPSTFIYNPVDTELLAERASRHDNDGLIASLGDYIVHVGAFTRQKNQMMMLEAWKASGVPHKLVFLGVGELQESVRQAAEAMGEEDRVVFAGFLPNPFPVVKHAKLFAASSLYEGFSMVLAEAVALGVPSVSTDCLSGPSEIVSPGHAHCLSPVGDVQAMAENIRRAVAEPEKYTVPLREDMTLKAVVGKYLDLVGWRKQVTGQA